MKNMILVIPVLLCMLPTHVIKGQNAAATLDSILQIMVQESGFAGVGAAVLVKDSIAWSGAYGFADVQNIIPFSTQTIMNIGGISKTVTAFCAMRAVQDGLLELDKDINRYLPFKVVNPFYPDDIITLRYLMTNTSGIVDRFPFYDSTYFYGGDSPLLLGDFAEDYLTPAGRYYSEQNFIKSSPGTFHRYSNIASGLVAYILELVTGRPFNAYSKEVLFDPLGMDATGWFLSEVDIKRHARLYEKSADSLKSVMLYGLVTYPDGGLRTSVADLARFLGCLMQAGKYQGKTILKEELAREIYTAQLGTEVDTSSIAIENLNIGFYTYIRPKTAICGSNGHDPGIRTRMWFNSKQQIGMILFSNSSFGSEDYGSHFMNMDQALWQYAATLAKNQD